MFCKKVKTEPCLFPESPFMRKPSKQFLKKITFNKNKSKQNQLSSIKQFQYLMRHDFSKMAFISNGSSYNFNSQKNQGSKLKKTTIELGKFKIKLENMVFRTQLQEKKQINSQILKQNQSLKRQNKQLKKQIDQLKKQLQTCSHSRISKFSQSTDQQTVVKDSKRINTKISSMQILQINSYDLLPTTMQISRANSLTFDDDLKSFDQFNFLSTPLNKKYKEQLKSETNFPRTCSQKIEIQILTNRILCLESQLNNCLQKQKLLETQNQSLRLCASMSKRRLDDKDCQLKQIKLKERKKKYFDKLFQLSSQEENEFC